MVGTKRKASPAGARRTSPRRTTSRRPVRSAAPSTPDNRPGDEDDDFLDGKSNDNGMADGDRKAGGNGKADWRDWRADGCCPTPLQVAPECTLHPFTRPGRVSLYSEHRRWVNFQSSWSRIGAGASALDAVHSSSSSGARLTAGLEEEGRAVRALVAQLCECFYHAGWATGTGGGASIRVGGAGEGRPWRVFVAPSGVMKEDVVGDDVFELDMDMNVVRPPKTPGMRLSACTPLWYVVYKGVPSARCVIHTHSMHAQLATLLDPTEKSGVLEITHLEMLKGVGGHSYDDVLRVPIIDNRPTEDMLADQLEAAIKMYPRSNAALVRRHGLYVWGDSWEQAKAQCESFDYLFEAAVKMKSLGLDSGVKPVSGTYHVEEEGVEGCEKEEEKEKNENGDTPPAKKQNVSNGAAFKVGNRATVALASHSDRASPKEEKEEEGKIEEENGKANGAAEEGQMGVCEKEGGKGEEDGGPPPAERRRVEGAPAPTPAFNAAGASVNEADLLCHGTTIPLVPRDARILLLDIEGTTTSISFVKDVLFPYVLKNLDGYLDGTGEDDLDGIAGALRKDLKSLDAGHPSRAQLENAAPMPAKDEVAAMVRALMAHDVKATGLKSLQGKMWRAGYASGELVGHLYADFVPMLEWCKVNGVKVCIYSSGSIGAQKLLFGHTGQGDITSYFGGHFDTTSGSKRDSASYGNIAKALGVQTDEVIFVSDLEAEIVAASSARMRAVVAVRPGNTPLTEVTNGKFPVVRSLLQLCGGP